MRKKSFHYVFIYLELLVFKCSADEPTVRLTKSDTLVSLHLGLSRALASKFSSELIDGSSNLGLSRSLASNF